MRIGSRDFATTGHTYIMGILNVTPDSFSDGGKFNQIDAALKHAEEMIRDGADVIDIGGESTRPGYTKISDEEETGRVVPVIEAVKKEFEIPISVDTYKSGVAEAAAQAGADLINDIWGLKYDARMAEVIAKSGLACCLMHNRDNTEYRNFMEDVKQDLRETIALAKAAGIADDKIILDPGVGFAKSYENNLEVIQQCDADGHVQATHERYDIFREIKKTIGATPEEDVVTIVLEQESVIEMRLRHLESGQGIQDGAIQDLGDVVSGLAEAQGVSL